MCIMHGPFFPLNRDGVLFLSEQHNIALSLERLIGSVPTHFLLDQLVLHLVNNYIIK